MSLRLRAFTPMLVALVFVLALSSSVLFAQDQPTPKVEVFAGYSWFNPGVTVNGINLSSDDKGFGIAPTYNFTDHFGITIDGAGHFGSHGKLGENQVGTLMIGPRFIWRQEHFHPFVEALVGGSILTIVIRARVPLESVRKRLSWRDLHWRCGFSSRWAVQFLKQCCAPVRICL